MTTAQPDSDAYDRGHLAGRIDQRLAGHDQHFAKLNGSTAELVVKVEEVARAVQRLADQATADAATRLQLASALRDADAARRASDHDQRAVRAHKLSPWLVALTVASTAVAVILGLRSLFG